ncbi:MAG TPA: hypothetical protein VL588_07075, partial [Bdellovibrionota bacterium]|nr:hypothetical protein [Bdellovibrionota bacterium]
MGRSLKIHDFVFSAALLAVLGGCNGVGQSQLKRPHLVVEPIASTPAGDDLVGLWTEDCRTVLGAGGAVVSASRRSLAFRPGGEFILYTTHFRKTGCEEPLFSAFESGQVTFQGPYLSGDATAVDFELKEGGFVLHSESGL